MELPEDVLALIRAYAKPRFQYFREYNGILKLIRKREWPRLKQRLQTEPHSILHAVLSYHSALINRENLFQEMEVLRTTVSWSEQTRYYNLGFYRLRDADDTFWVLNRLLYNQEERRFFPNIPDLR